MPELPEVETVRRSLEPRLFESAVTDVEASKLSLRQKPLDRAALGKLVGARFTAARRIGKYLLLDTSSEATVLVHLGMSGRLLLSARDVALPAHTHVRLTFESGLELRYVDPRRFGSVRVYATDGVHRSAELSILGPDPLSDAFTREGFVEGLSRTKRDLKSALLDQKLVTGLGNIYVSEALFVARLSPRRRAHRVKAPEASALYDAVRDVLLRGVANRGTTFSDYVDADGNLGSNQHTLFVYGRDGQACRACETVIRRLVQGGRSTFYCSSCQVARK
jgi:formamidopyrimidine-DNA glycosylase